MTRVARTGIILAAIVAVATVAMAAKIKVRTEHDETFDFTGKKTYAWHPDGTGEVKLLQNSYEKPDVLKEKLDPIIIGAVPAWGLPDFMMSTTALRFFEQGTLVVDISSVAAKATVWRGVAEAEIDRDNSPQEREKRIRGAVAEMLKKFPPPPPKKK